MPALLLVIRLHAIGPVTGDETTNYLKGFPLPIISHRSTIWKAILTAVRKVEHRLAG